MATRESINNSKDVKIALDSKKIALTRYSSVQTDIRQNERPSNISNDEKLIHLVKRAISEHGEHQKNEISEIEEKVSKVIKDSIEGLVSSIRNHIASPAEIKHLEPEIDPVKLAEISQKSIQNISDAMESNTLKPKKINIVNKNLNDLANEI